MGKELDKIVDDYDLATDITAAYVYQLRYAVRRLSAYLKRPATIDDLQPDTVNRWLKRERDAMQISDRSRANVRRSILTIWRNFGAGFNRDSVRSVVVTPKNPEAWHYDEMKSVADAAGQLPGSLSNGIPRALYMQTTLWAAYETGLRRSDLWTFDVTHFDRDRRAAITQHKTKRVHVISITDETDETMRQIAGLLRASRDPRWMTPLRWPQSTTQFYYWMQVCRENAGVEPHTRNRSLQHIRRTGATEVAVEGGHAWQFLGHSREGLDRKSYVDARMTMAPTTPTRNRTNGICSRT